MNPIKFGTSGWRGVLAEDFTFERVRLVTQAIADDLHRDRSGAPIQVVVGHDTRFLGDRFSEAVADVLTANGIQAIRSVAPVPTPVISFEILRRKLSGGIIVTASHNPSEWNGLKFSPAWGGPALPETTRRIEERANRLLEGAAVLPRPPLSEGRAEGLRREEALGEAYRERVSRFLDEAAFRRGPLRIAVDLFWGTARGYLDALLKEKGASIDLLHAAPDPTFGGIRPDPEGESLGELIRKVQEGDYSLGLATDCDADRFGVIDRGGIVIPPNYIIALLVDYLATERKMTGKVARSVATSHLIDAVARSHRLEVIETPVGFKYIGELIAKDELLLGGEESGGISIRGHLPEKDGIFAALLAAEMVARRGRSLRALLEALFQRVGAFYPQRQDLPLTPEGREKLLARLQRPPAAIAGRKVLSLSRIDGVKFFLEGGGWLLVRPSGTEPIARLYAETSEEKETRRLIEAGQELIA